MTVTSFATLTDGLQFLSLFDQAFANALNCYAPQTVTGTTAVPSGQLGDVLVNSSGACTITLPLSSSQNNQPLSVVDISGAASTNNITIAFSGSDKFMGLTSTAIKTNYGGLTFWPLVSGGYYLK